MIFSNTRRWNDASTALIAAPNAHAIKAMTGTTTNAAYWIDTGSGAVQTFCLMSTPIGYMLAAKIADIWAIASRINTPGMILCSGKCP